MTYTVCGRYLERLLVQSQHPTLSVAVWVFFFFFHVSLYDAGPFIIKRVDVFLRVGRGIYSSMSGLWLPLVP